MLMSDICCPRAAAAPHPSSRSLRNDPAAVGVPANGRRVVALASHGVSRRALVVGLDDLGEGLVVEVGPQGQRLPLRGRLKPKPGRVAVPSAAGIQKRLLSSLGGGAAATSPPNSSPSIDGNAPSPRTNAGRPSCRRD